MNVLCMFFRIVLRCRLLTARVRNKVGLGIEAEAKLAANDRHSRQIH